MNRDSHYAAGVAALLMAACNPSVPFVSFFEPMNTVTGASDSWLLPIDPSADRGRANQAASAERLGGLSGTTNVVRYRMLDRFSAFMFTGDLSTGVPAAGQTFESLQLPALAPADASGNRPAREVDIMAFDPRKWTSFRVYNRGACSKLEAWPEVAQDFADGLAAQLNADDRVRRATVTSGSLGVVLRSEFPANDVSTPDDRDELHLTASISAEQVGDYCANVSFDLDLGLVLEHTDRMYLEVQDRAFAVSCGLRDELEDYNAHVPARCQLPTLDDPFWLDPEQTKAALGTSADAGLSLSPVVDLSGLVRSCDLGFFLTIGIETTRISRDLAHDRPVSCDAGAQMLFSFDASDWQIERRTDFSGRDAGSDDIWLLSLADFDGHDLGAHDTLARVSSYDLSEWHADCGHPGGVRSRKTMRGLRTSVRNNLPLAVARAARGAAVQGPSNLLDPNDWVDCQTDADCDFRASRGPAYALGDQWRGARHVCRADPTDSSCSPQKVCWPAIEVDRLNVRPEGLETVVEDDLDLDASPRDPQVSFFSDVLVRGETCDVGETPRRGLGFLRDDLDPDDVSRGRMVFEFSSTTGGSGGSCTQPPPPPSDAP